MRMARHIIRMVYDSSFQYILINGSIPKEMIYYGNMSNFIIFLEVCEVDIMLSQALVPEGRIELCSQIDYFFWSHNLCRQGTVQTEHYFLQLHDLLFARFHWVHLHQIDKKSCGRWWRYCQGLNPPVSRGNIRNYIYHAIWNSNKHTIPGSTLVMTCFNSRVYKTVVIRKTTDNFLGRIT